MKIYWYAPQLRPPEFGGVPKGWLDDLSGLFLDRLYPQQRYKARAYPKELDTETVNHFDLKLVAVEMVGSMVSGTEGDIMECPICERHRGENK